MSRDRLIRILIVDDEFIVRMGFKNLMDWEVQGYTMVGEAKNSAEALNLLQNEHPDIVICDIKLGTSDGITLLKKMKELAPQVRVVMLTHYDSFELAREALRCGADEYLLKSELSPELILQTLNRLFQGGGEVHAKEARMHSKSNLQQCLESLIIQGCVKDETLLSGLRETYAVSIISVYPNEDSKSTDLRQLSQQIFSILEDLLRSHSATFATESIDNQIVIFFAFSTANANLESYIVSCMEHLHKSLETLFGVENLIGSSAPCLAKGIDTAYNQAREALDHAYFLPQHTACSTVSCLSSAEGLCQPELNTILDLLRGQNEPELTDYIKECFASCSQISDVRQVFNDFLSYIKPISVFRAVELSQNILRVKLSYQIFDELCGVATACQYIIDLYLDCFMQVNGSNNHSRTIRKCLEFIHQNYQKNLSLTEIADYVEVSNTYLSTLFKQEMNVNIIAYINSYRIKQAQKLMTGSNLRMYEIAMQVGFENPYYFSKVFKEITGMTCKEYRSTR